VAAGPTTAGWSRHRRARRLATRWESSRRETADHVGRLLIRTIETRSTDPRLVGGPHVFTRAQRRAVLAGADGADEALPDAPVHVVVVDREHGGRVYLGTDVGVFVSDDGGNTWAVENTGYGAIVTESLSLVRDAGGQTWLFAFTHGRGVWKVRVR
jgi:hypothetical protein